ncbi:MAG: LPP20 family lipoprotein [Gammaproteobacteria bacterium]|nr:LPP20 family lipoprotein [Gammaproteobacteria bacterium]
MSCKNLKKNYLVAIILSFIASNVAAASQMAIPSWVLNPSVEDGLAAVDCVKFSGNVSVDAKLASSNARLALSQQIETRVEGLDETFDSRISNDDATRIQTKFSSHSKQATKQVLSGSKIVRSDVVSISGKDYFCSMASLDPKKAKSLFDDIVVKTKGDIKQPLKEELLQQFQQPSATEVESKTNLKPST